MASYKNHMERVLSGRGANSELRVADSPFADRHRMNSMLLQETCSGRVATYFSMFPMTDLEQPALSPQAVSPRRDPGTNGVQVLIRGVDLIFDWPTHSSANPLQSAANCHPLTRHLPTCHLPLARRCPRGYNPSAMDVETRYQEALDYLYSFVDFSLTHQDNLSLDDFNLVSMRSLVAELGDPHQAYPSIHVAGTKGKGSVCAFCAAA